MAGISMGDGPTIAEIVARHGDPLDSTARAYFEALEWAAKVRKENPKEAADLQKAAERAFEILKQFGRRPEMVEGVARAAEASD